MSRCRILRENREKPAKLVWGLGRQIETREEAPVEANTQDEAPAHAHTQIKSELRKVSKLAMLSQLSKLRLQPDISTMCR